GRYEAQGFGTEINAISVKKINGFPTEISVELMQDNTILKVLLQEAILPNGSITFQITFKTYFDDADMRRRMKMFNSFGNKHYDGVHWYPRMCVYDRKFGWETDQHLGKEFYGDYGTYEVQLTFPHHYIVDATGTLMNPEDVMPASLREKLDIKNFEDKEWDSEPSVIIEKIAGEKKTWKYFAMNVHDFAFTADPTYRIGESAAMVNGRLVHCVALVQEPHAAGWQNASDYTKKIIETLSGDFGEYIYPKIIVADARDGMEYPMLTLDGGFDPYYRDLLIHEVGHQWFFAMVGNNETYRASLDEGFTQFLTAWCYNRIDGDVRIVYPEESKYKKKYRDPEDIHFTEVYYGYLSDAIRHNDKQLNTHSDDFNSATGHGGGYRHVYYKTATMLYNLQYVLGDELFLAAMKNYVHEWRICHPYFEDFRNSIINYTHVDLNWFFDQWLETTKTIDYAVADVKPQSKPEAERSYTITFKRKGEMQMPLDFSVVLDNGETLFYHIPNTWFEKKSDASTEILNQTGITDPLKQYPVTVLPKWTGWGSLNETYTATITVNVEIKNVIIDPSNRLADINKLDNRWKCPIAFEYDSRLASYPDWNHYELKWRPNIRLNTIDIAKVGAAFNGNYMNNKHVFELF
ncbi:MAG: M1 family peptidase, partial [Chitinophagales bacterium]|nr:M1 family peptidase [Chitinophagales bacterium]